MAPSTRLPRGGREVITLRRRLPAVDFEAFVPLKEAAILM